MFCIKPIPDPKPKASKPELKIEESEENDVEEGDENLGKRMIPMSKYKAQKDRKILGEKKCEVCIDKKSKYRCQGCNFVYCGVACFKKHKDDCSGDKLVTSFIPLERYSYNSLKRDFSFISKVLNGSDKVKIFLYRLKRN